MSLDSLITNGFCEIDDISVADIESILEVTNEYSVEKVELVPNKESAHFKHTLSSQYRLDNFPFHTDGAHRRRPPRWIVLAYESSVASQACTLLFDTKTLSRKQEFDNLFNNEIYLVDGGKEKFLTPLINKQMDVYPVFRWNRLLMRKILNLTNCTIDDYIGNNIEKISWRKNKKLIIDNWRVLHGREPIPIEELTSRKLLRYNYTPK